jgi:hypothetical protein
MPAKYGEHAAKEVLKEVLKGRSDQMQGEPRGKTKITGRSHRKVFWAATWTKQRIHLHFR